ncbi:hypothetical protein D3C72_2251250 [compost metagenome]
MFRHGVGKRVRDDCEGVRRGDVEDDAVAHLDHAGKHGPAAVPRTLEIDVEAALPIGIAQRQRL